MLRKDVHLWRLDDVLNIFINISQLVLPEWGYFFCKKSNCGVYLKGIFPSCAFYSYHHLMTKKDTKLEQPKQEPIVPIEKPVVPSPEQKTEQDVSLEKVKADIAVLKKDNEILQTKQADFEKNKTTLPKEESDKLKQEIETEAKRIEAKKIEILTLIKQTKQELANLKGTVET